MNTIKIEKHGDDYMAFIGNCGHKGFWDCGKTPEEAIGNLIKTWGERLNIELEFPKK